MKTDDQMVWGGVVTMNRDGVMEDELDDRLSVLSAVVEDTQLTTSGALPRRSPLTIARFSTNARTATHHTLSYATSHRHGVLYTFVGGTVREAFVNILWVPGRKTPRSTNWELEL